MDYDTISKGGLGGAALEIEEATDLNNEKEARIGEKVSLIGLIGG